MRLITNEYTTLLNDMGEVAMTIYPNVEFDAFLGGYTVTSAAIIKDVDTGKIVQVLQAGEKIKGVGTVKENPFQELSSSQLKELCRESGISFKSKATKVQLIELLS